MNDLISQSKINLYLSCSKKYFYKYIERREPSNATNIKNLFLGLFVHKAIEQFIRNKKIIFVDILYDTLKEKDLFLTEIEDLREYPAKFFEFIKKNMKNEYYTQIFEQKIEELKTKTNIYPSTFDIAKTISEEVIKYCQNLFKNFVKIETEKRLEFGNILGYLDILAITDDFQQIILDFKTTKKEPTIQKKIQDILYSWLVYKLTNEIPKFKYIYIKYTEKEPITCEIKEFDLEYKEKDFEIIEDLLENFKKGVENNVFLRNEGSFLCNSEYCEFYNYCLSYKLEKN